MLDNTTLVALACMIANKGPVDTASIEVQLSEAERTLVQQIIAEGSCLPESLENLITKSRGVSGSDDAGSPSKGCG